eukprot:scaffold63650_cov83-Phaeocystis_antarctica.AAC.9
MHTSLVGCTATRGGAQLEPQRFQRVERVVADGVGEQQHVRLGTQDDDVGIVRPPLCDVLSESAAHAHRTYLVTYIAEPLGNTPEDKRIFARV